MDIKISFVKAFSESLEINYKYSNKYIQMQVGILAKNGIKTWYDLLMLSEQKLKSVKGLSMNSASTLTRMHEHEIRAALRYAGKKVVEQYGSGFQGLAFIGSDFERYFSEYCNIFKEIGM